jgi:hypothetical protein
LGFGLVFAFILCSRRLGLRVRFLFHVAMFLE